VNPFVIGLVVLVALAIVAAVLALLADKINDEDAAPRSERPPDEAAKARQALLNWFRTAAQGLPPADRQEVLEAIDGHGLWHLWMALQKMRSEGRLPAAWDPMLLELHAWTR